TRAQVLLGELGELGDRFAPLADLLTRVARHPAGNRAFAETVTGLDTRYETLPDTGHPWQGRLAPDLTLTTDSGRRRLTELLAPGRGVLVDLTGGTAVRATAAGWADRVDTVTATCPDHPDLRADLRAVLLRPDGHTAWVRGADGRLEGLVGALRHWFGDV
ncbi:monooxygenase, partial [Kitasatospora sp. NPDC093558]